MAKVYMMWRVKNLRMYILLSIILIMLLLKPALSQGDYVDYVDLGILFSEDIHNANGWGEVPKFNPYTSPSGDNSKHYMAIGGECSVDMDVQELNVPYTLAFEVEDGNCDDSFEVWIDNEELYYVVGQNYGKNYNDIRTYKVKIPAEYLKSSSITVKFKNIASDSCGRAAIYNVGLIKGEIECKAPSKYNLPIYFTSWSNKAIDWADGYRNSLNWNGLCMRFVAATYKESVTATGEHDANVWAGLLPLYDREIDPEVLDQTPNDWKKIPKGAVIFFAGTPDNTIGHVGIHIGNGWMIHAFGRVNTTKISKATSLTDDGKLVVGPYIGWSYPPESWRPASVTPTIPLEISPESAGSTVPLVGEWTLHSRRDSDSIPSDSTITFYADHTLDDTLYGRGTWSQSGNTIQWEYNMCGEEISTRFKTAYYGTIDLGMEGTMQSCDGEEGDWSADRRYTEPGIMA